MLWSSGVTKKSSEWLTFYALRADFRNTNSFHATGTRLLVTACGDMKYRDASVRRLRATNEELDVTAQTLAQ
jgi:hypothetical protein